VRVSVGLPKMALPKHPMWTPIVLRGSSLQLALSLPLWPSSLLTPPPGISMLDEASGDIVGVNHTIGIGRLPTLLLQAHP
jgi:hypothetical protein